MRNLKGFEIASVSGGENHQVTVVDPVEGLKLFLALLQMDRQSFSHGLVVTGMIGGAAGGAFVGYSYAQSCVAAGGTAAMAAGGAGGLAAGLAGAVVGGVALRVGAAVALGAYDLVMS